MALLSNLYPGIRGVQGIQGIQGSLGSQGVQGVQGVQGGETKGFNITTINGPYTLQTSDVGNLIKINSGVSTVSISSNTFSFGNSFMIYNGTSTKQTISQGAGVSFYSISHQSKIPSYHHGWPRCIVRFGQFLGR